MLGCVLDPRSSHYAFSPAEIMFIALPMCLFILSVAPRVRSFCGASVRWTHYLNIEDAYGMWYGVGYTQHTPDMTNKPIRIGCITLYITDAMADLRDDWRDWSVSSLTIPSNNFLLHVLFRRLKVETPTHIHRFLYYCVLKLIEEVRTDDRVTYSFLYFDRFSKCTASRQVKYKN